MSRNGQQLPPGWAETTLAEIVEPRSGKANPQDTPDEQFIGMEQVEAHTMRLLGTVSCGSMKSTANVFSPSDVLYGRLRSYLNKVYQPDFAGLCSGEFIVLPETSAVLGRFLKYRLNAGDFVSFASHINAGDRPRVDFDQIKVFTIRLPPRPEQQRIADALDELLSDLDAGVLALERVREKLKLYRASVLKAAVEGSLTAEWRAQHPHTEPAAELLKRILDERRRRWEEEQLAKFREKGKEPPTNWKAKYKEPVTPDTVDLSLLPKGWCWATLDQISSLVTSGSRGWKEYYTQDGAIFIRSQDIRTDQLKLDTAAHVSPPDKTEGARTKVCRGDLLVTITGANVAKATAVKVELPEAYVSQHVGLIRLVSPELGKFVHVYTVSPSGGRKRLLASAYGAGKPGLNLDNLRELPIPLPPVDESEAVVEAVEDQLSVIEHLEADFDAKLNSARALRQAILSHAFTGQLVPQDPNDEPASELLKRIAAEREARAREASDAKLAGKPADSARAGRRGHAKSKTQGNN